ncbi:MAG: bifunctional folylpolyglutamate synthase/dihydrofolate synthase [Deltaproteobacteria bacterium]|jgi:dihydrofolate synthase/folylpolyglutamate synthase|nr:bifunctional folylpolyglutamate synthase/dihydrofolate synthase [Deltaproteobacteria bacterium]
MDYKETIFRLFELQKFGIKLGLDSMRTILGRLGNPQDGGRFVHVSGTNGKGSTMAFLEAVLSRAGYKVGLYTSPHLVTFRERIRLGGRMVTEDEVMGLASEVWEATDPAKPPTFFEFVTAMAFLFFKRAGADIALMETGMGGRLDSTNVLEPLVSAVTNVGLEHTEHLGPTIPLIAFEKAGVIKPGKPFFAGRLSTDALTVIEDRAKELGTQVSLLGRDFKVRAGSTPEGLPRISFQGSSWNYHELDLGLMGAHQADNAALALAILEKLSGMGYPVAAMDIRAGLRWVSWPGRGELFPPGAWPPDGSGKAPLLLDGAHNPDGAKALSALLSERPERAIHLVAGVMADKDVGGVLSPLLPRSTRVYLTRPEYSRAEDPSRLLGRLGESLPAGDRLAGLFQRIPDAIGAAARDASEGDLVVVAGSLFTVGEARAWLTGQGLPESN